MFIQSEGDQEICGRYNVPQANTHQEYTASYSHVSETRNSGKVYGPEYDNRNILRLVTAMFSMLMLFPFALFFMIFIAGPQNWLGFGIASLVIFLIAVITIDKIQ